MLCLAARGHWQRALLISVAAAHFVGCSPDTFLSSDEDRDRDFLRARDAERLGDFPGAAEYYERALDRNPRSALVHLGYASICEGSLRRYADAVYHYQRYLRLRPDDPKADDIRRRVTNCMELLATSVPVVIRSETIARDLAAVRRENLMLRAQLTNLVREVAGYSNEVGRLTQLAAQSAGMATPSEESSRSRAAATRSDAGRTGAREAASMSASSAAGGRPRAHRIQRGDTLHSIARRYGVDLGALRRANPRVNERRLIPGATVVIP